MAARFSRLSNYFFAGFFFFRAFPATMSSSPAPLSSSLPLSDSCALRLSPRRALFLDPGAGAFISFAALALLPPFTPEPFFPEFAFGLSTLSFFCSSVSFTKDCSSFNSSFLLASDFGSGNPLLGSFLEPGSFSYSPPASSYDLASFAAYKASRQISD